MINFNFNQEIETLFNNFSVDGVTVPVAFLFYNGHGAQYVVYSETDKDAAYAADDQIAGFVAFYDFEIYSKSNYLNIANAIINILQSAGWTWQPSRDSADMYENDTGYFHKTYCFAKEKQPVNDN